MDALVADNGRYLRSIEEIDAEIATGTFNEGYAKTLEAIAKRLEQHLSSLDQDAEGAQELVRLVVDSVIVHSRPAVESDLIGGRKKENQQIPNKLEVKLKLPQAMVDSYMTSPSLFGVKVDKL